MKLRNPISREDLNIKKNAYVLEVGSGHNPTYRANVVVDKYMDSNYHRSGDIKIYPHQKFVNADGAKMPFKDKEFDYVICNQVLEHTEDPKAFIKEIQRVGKRGYIELPSLIGESLFPKSSHRWACLEIDGKLILFEKNKLPLIYPDYGSAFLNILPYQSLALRMFFLSYHQINCVRYEWKDSIDILVNPQDDFYYSFFSKQWTEEMVRTIFPPRSKIQELTTFIKALAHLIKCMISHKIQHHEPISITEYKRLLRLT